MNQFSFTWTDSEFEGDFFSFYLLHCSPAGGDIVNSMADQWDRILPNQGIIRHLASSGVY